MLREKIFQKKIIVILGPTASGKTKLAVRLACQFNGEIVSADSRQVYQGMDIGTGKDLDDYVIKLKNQSTNWRIKLKTVKIPYHLIDVASPKKQFNLADYQRLAYQAIDKILKKGKLPILVGGSGLYLQAVVDGWILPKAKPNKKLRQELEKKNIAQLFSFLKKLDKDFAKKVNESDRKNKRRLIRYIEILKHLPDLFLTTQKQAGVQNDISLTICNSVMAKKKYNTLILGITYPKKILNQRIKKRLEERLKQGLIEEVKLLRRQGLGWRRLEQFGLEYKFVAYHLQGKLSYDEMAEKLKTAIQQFAKRQLTWFQRWEKMGGKIHWLKNEKEAVKLIKKFLKMK